MKIVVVSTIQISFLIIESHSYSFFFLNQQKFIKNPNSAQDEQRRMKYKQKAPYIHLVDIDKYLLNSH